MKHHAFLKSVGVLAVLILVGQGCWSGDEPVTSEPTPAPEPGVYDIDPVTSPKPDGGAGTGPVTEEEPALTDPSQSY